MRDFLTKRLERLKRHPEYTGPKKGIGVVGLSEGRTLLVGLARASFCRAIAGCDQNEQKIVELQHEHPDLFYTRNYESMLGRPDIDIVAIYTPDALHGQHMIQALEAGKDVICAKPMLISMEDARKVLEAGRRTGRKLFVGQSTRFFEPFIRQRQSYDRGLIGELELVDAHYIHRMDWFYEKSPWAATDTDWIFLGMSHPVDLVRWYLGRIEEVHAYGFTTKLGKQYGLKGFDLYTVHLRTHDGRLGRALGHYGLKELPSARNSIELMLYGTRNSSLAQYHDMKYRYSNDDGTEMLEDPLYELRHYYFNSEIHGMHYGEFANYADYFAEALLTNRPYSPDLEEGIETFCVMEAIRRSARQGGPVAVRPLLQEVGLER